MDLIIGGYVGILILVEEVVKQVLVFKVRGIGLQGLVRVQRVLESFFFFDNRIMDELFLEFRLRLGRRVRDVRRKVF